VQISYVAGDFVWAGREPEFCPCPTRHYAATGSTIGRRSSRISTFTCLPACANAIAYSSSSADIVMSLPFLGFSSGWFGPPTDSIADSGLSTSWRWPSNFPTVGFSTTPGDGSGGKRGTGDQEERGTGWCTGLSFRVDPNGEEVRPIVV